MQTQVDRMPASLENFKKGVPGMDPIGQLYGRVRVE